MANAPVLITIGLLALGITYECHVARQSRDWRAAAEAEEISKAKHAASIVQGQRDAAQRLASGSDASALDDCKMLMPVALDMAPPCQRRL
jgi:hypothetical protein